MAKTKVTTLHVKSRRDVYRSKTLRIARDAGARFVDEFKLPTGDDMLVFWAKGNTVLVRVDDDGCFHYVQGGPKWIDLALDLGHDGSKPFPE